MSSDPSHSRLHLIGRGISIGIMIGAAVIALLVVRQMNANPRTDDAEVFANFIGMAPVVNGPVTHLYVSDNQLVKVGDPLFDIDERPYAYALARAYSDQHALEGQISDERRIIAATPSAVDVAKTSVFRARAILA
jgi:multidrug efflux system membrane fusion protein